MAKTKPAPQCHCLRCDHKWTPRKKDGPPKRCPRCITVGWDKLPRPGKYRRGQDHPKHKSNRSA